MRQKTQIRIERAVTLELLGRKGREIAPAVGLSLKGLESLKARVEYRERREQLAREMLARMDEDFYAEMRSIMLAPLARGRNRSRKAEE